MEMEEERKARLEKMAATKRFRLAMEEDEERRARLEKMVAITQLGFLPLSETEEERIYKKGMDLIWIKFGLRLDFSKFQGMSSLAL